MPDQITKLLDQIDRLDQEATKGPWEIDPSEGHAWAIGNGEDGLYVNGTDKDAEFIALARTALPQLAKALQAVINTLDDYPLPQKQYDPTGIALAELSTLEQRVREAITDEMGAGDDDATD